MKKESDVSVSGEIKRTQFKPSVVPVETPAEKPIASYFSGIGIPEEDQQYVIDTIQAMTKPQVVQAVIECLPHKYPTKTAATKITATELRRDLAAFLALSFLGRAATALPEGEKVKPFTHADLTAIADTAAKHAREIEIQRIEQKAADRALDMARDRERGPVLVTPPRQGSPALNTILALGAMGGANVFHGIPEEQALPDAPPGIAPEKFDLITHRAQTLIEDHGRVHGVVRDHDRRDAVRVAHREVFGYKPGETLAIAKAADKRARKAAQRTAQAS